MAALELAELTGNVGTLGYGLSAIGPGKIGRAHV